MGILDAAAEEDTTAMDVEDEEDERSEAISIANQHTELGISTFHTNLLRLVGPQPRIVEDKVSIYLHVYQQRMRIPTDVVVADSGYGGTIMQTAKIRHPDMDTVGKASGFGPERRKMRLWHEAVSSLFISQPASRERLINLFG